MKTLMKIAVVLSLLGTCQFGWAMEKAPKIPSSSDDIIASLYSIFMKDKPNWGNRFLVKEERDNNNMLTHAHYHYPNGMNEHIYFTPTKDRVEYQYGNWPAICLSIPIPSSSEESASSSSSSSTSSSSATTKTAQTTTTQPTETVSVTSSSSSSTSSSATSNAPDSIYGKLLLNPSSWGKGTIVFEGRDHRHVHYDNGLDEFTYYSESLQCPNHLSIYYVYNNLPPYYMCARVDDANSSIFHRITGWVVERNDLPQSALHEVSSSSSTSSATTTQPIETVSVTSSSSSEDEEIYGPQTTPTLTKEAQALFSSTLPAVIALAITTMAMQTKSAH